MTLLHGQRSLTTQVHGKRELTSQVHGQRELTVRLQGEVGVYAEKARHLIVAILASAGVAALASADKPFLTTVAAASAVQGAISMEVHIDSQVASEATVTGKAERGRGLQGAINGTATLTGQANLITGQALACVEWVYSDLTGQARVDRRLSGTVVGNGNVPATSMGVDLGDTGVHLGGATSVAVASVDTPALGRGIGLTISLNSTTTIGIMEAVHLKSDKPLVGNCVTTSPVAVPEVRRNRGLSGTALGSTVVALIALGRESNLPAGICVAQAGETVTVQRDRGLVGETGGWMDPPVAALRYQAGLVGAVPGSLELLPAPTLWSELDGVPQNLGAATCACTSGVDATMQEEVATVVTAYDNFVGMTGVPAGYTRMWSTAGLFYVTDGGEDGKVLKQMTGYGNWRGLRKDSLNSPTDSEGLMLLMFDNSASTEGQLVFRGSGSAGTETAYIIGIQGGYLRVQRLVNGTKTLMASYATIVFSPGNWCWVRGQAIGNTLQARIWAAGTAEPIGTWHITLTNNDIVEPGWNGLGVWDDSGNYFDNVGWATNGGTAPGSPNLVLMGAATCANVASEVAALTNDRPLGTATCDAVAGLDTTVMQKLTEVPLGTAACDAMAGLNTTQMQVLAAPTGQRYIEQFNYAAGTDMTTQGWTKYQGEAGATYTVQDNAFGIDGKAGAFTQNGSVYHLHTWNAPGNVQDLQLLLRFKAPSSVSGEMLLLHLQAAANTFSVSVGSGYTQAYAPTGFTVGSGAFTVDPNITYWMRIYMLGGTFRLRMWVDGSAEPATWLIDRSSLVFQTGAVRMGSRHNSTVMVDFISLATNGLEPTNPALFWTDWSDQIIGANPPAGWTKRGDTTASWIVEADITAVSGKKVRRSSGGETTNCKVLSLNAVGTPNDVEVLALLSGGSATVGWLTARASGTNYFSNWNDYHTTQDTISASLVKRANGASTSLGSSSFPYTAGNKVWVRLRCVGSTIQAKQWNKDDAEPSTWTVTATDSSHTSGWVGLFTYSQPTELNVEVVSVALCGFTAPTTNPLAA
jgi:hypothetical protein